MSWNRRGKAEGQVFTPCATPLRASSSLTWDGRAPLAVAGLAQRSVGVGDAAAAALSVELRVFDSRQNATLQVDMVDQAIALGVDGIIIQHGLAESMKAAAQRAVNAGIKVVAFDINVESDKIPQIEQSDYDLGPPRSRAGDQ